MAVNEESINLLKFSTSVQFDTCDGGVSPEQVRSLLVKLPPIADEVTRLNTRLAEVESRAAEAQERLLELNAPEEVDGKLPKVSRDFDETLRNTLVSAQRQADVLIADARAEAERVLSEAETQSTARLAEANLSANEIEEAASVAAERLTREIEVERAARLREIADSTRGLKEKLQNELHTNHIDKRNQLVSEIDSLSHGHGILLAEMQRFETHIAKRRTEVRVAVSELTDILENPEKLAVSDPIQPADYVQNLPTEVASNEIDATGLTELEADLAAASEGFAADAQAAADLIQDPFIPTEDSVQAEARVYVEEDLTSTDGDETDKYLEELERIAAESGTEDDTVQEFLNDSDADSAGWFGRRKHNT